MPEDQEKIHDEEKTFLGPLPVVRALFLVLIKLNPEITGYQLIRMVSKTTNKLIEVKSGTVYTELRRLERFGFVHSSQSSEGRKQRHYKITNEGINELTRLNHQIKIRINFLLKPLRNLIDSSVNVENIQ